MNALPFTTANDAGGSCQIGGSNDPCGSGACLTGAVGVAPGAGTKVSYCPGSATPGGILCIAPPPVDPSIPGSVPVDQM